MEAAAIEARLAKCLQFKLTFHSKVSMMLDGQGFLFDLKADLTLRATNSTRATGTGTLRWLKAEWVGDYGECSYIVKGSPSTFNAAGPRFGLSLTRVSQASPAVNVSLHYDPGKPVENAALVCPLHTKPQPPTTFWWEAFTQLHSYERDSGGFNAKAPITNVGTFTGWVYHNTGSMKGATITDDAQIDIEHTPAR